MNIFETHKSIVADYKRYIESFINIKDERIKAKVDEETKEGVLCPEPLIQFNPSFKYDISLENLIQEDDLHPSLNRIFEGFQLYKHQVDALRLGCNGKDFVVTSGTGSGKSLTYIGTIFNSILKSDKPGIKAIIVYPMNALINSQTEELNKFKENFGDDFPISYQQYTGQEGQEVRDKVRQNPPDILLTNYMMLELIMTRATEVDRAIRKSIKDNLLTLVFDEMHTYKGRQGSDVSMLIRRIKAYVKNEIQCIGTSATMASGVGTEEDQKREVAQVASNLFGKSFSSDQIVGETLTRLTANDKIPDKPELQKAIAQTININDNEESLRTNTIAVWIENRIGLIEIEKTLKRRSPIQFKEIVDLLSEESGVSRNECEIYLQQMLLWSGNVNQQLRDQNIRRAYFPFRLHQFISQTGSVFVTLENKDLRTIQLNPGYFIQNKDNEKQRIYPVVFSRITGHEFICVKKNYNTDTLEPRSFRDAYDEDESTQSGYIIIQDKNASDLWDDSMIENLPDSWYRTLKNGTVRIDKKYVNRIPSRIYFNSLGKFSDSQALIDSGIDLIAWFMPAKLIFDPTCFVFYDLKSSEASKLMTLGNEGRSTATTVLSLSTINQLNQAGLSEKDQKLLSFTDNRQDASLQSGHFNDFVNIGLIRSAIYHALKNEENHTLTINRIGEKVMQGLNLPQDTFATIPGKFTGAKKDNEDALTDYLTIRILQDLKKAWRYTMPNLEQCGLLKISYKYIQEEIENPDAWDDIPYLNKFSPEDRLDFVESTLDFFRTSNAINHRFFFNERKSIESNIKSKLKPEWGLTTGEQIPYPNYLRYESVGRIYQRGTFTKSIGKQSAWGKYASKILLQDHPLSGDEYIEFCQAFFNRLEEFRLLKSESIVGEKGETIGYLLNADVINWELGDYKTVKFDKVRIRTSGDEIQLKPNQYFQEYYQQETSDLQSIRSAEHTGQIKNEDRKIREVDFRSGKLSTLFCSPTMELGIDISNLNVVHMRNVPPSPANYAQRSGRAGRSGQGALVITYCSQYSPHDRNYFANKLDMVSGIVQPPRLTLDNYDLLVSHINAMYFLEAGIHISSSITDIIDEHDLKKLSIKAELWTKLKDGHETRKKTIMQYVEKLLVMDTTLSEVLDLDQAEKIIDNAPMAFDNAFIRWRRLYKNAIKLRDDSRAIIDNPIYSSKSDEKKQAERSESFAKKQFIQLRNDDSKNSFSEFYPFRYLASEGFLPGYNFTKLPIRVAINGYETTEYLSRPRSIALSEYGPRNIIYHNGQSYEIKRINANDIEKNITQTKAKVSKSSGYFLFGDEYNRETCPITGENLAGDNGLYVNNLLEMTESSAEIRQRISSEEEERMRLGYDLSTYFSLPKGVEANDKIMVKSGSDILLKIMYMPTTNIISVNKKWNRSKREFFLIDKRFGFWKKESDAEKDEENRILSCSLYTEYTANALYIQPVKNLGLGGDQIISLQFALRRAIEEYFQIEPSEIAVTLMGQGDASNILIYEATEGSLGVLSQFAKDQSVFRKVMAKAYEICHFNEGDDTKPGAGPASYEDLLNYYNQRYHEQIDRHEIQDVMEKLMRCKVEIQLNSNGDYESHYADLIANYDKNSSTEYTFLKKLYDNGLRLPDKAQPRLKEKFGLYVMPDFQYGDRTFVFCDGSPHDKQEIKDRDHKQRKAMRKAGLRYIVYYYKDDFDAVVADNKDIFIKVKES